MPTIAIGSSATAGAGVAVGVAVSSGSAPSSSVWRYSLRADGLG